MGALSAEVEWPGHEAYHSALSNASVKDGDDIHPLPILFHGVVLNYLSTGTAVTSVFTFQAKAEMVP
jgi:hypothetical protein